MTAVVYCKKKTEVCVDDVQKILETVDTSRLSTQTPQKPKGSEIYVYKYGDATTKSDWVADGYRWFNAGCDRLPRSRPVLYKRKFQIVNGGGRSCEFKRVVYSKCGPSAEQYIVVQYVGDETVAEDLPRGNLKKNRDEAQPFQHTAPSVVSQQAAEVKDRQSLELHQSSVTAADNVQIKPSSIEVNNCY